jgi:hypothetical protein
LDQLVSACDKREAFAQGSDSDEAIHLSASGEMDCFAEPVIGRASRDPLARNDGEKASGPDYRVFQNATTRWAVEGIRRT